MTAAGGGDGAAVLVVVPEGLGAPRRPGPGGGRAHRHAHQVAGVREARAAVGARRLCLPPDAPEVSPRAEGWATRKARWRTPAARTLERLPPASTEAVAAITSQEAQGWLTHAG